MCFGRSINVRGSLISKTRKAPCEPLNRDGAMLSNLSWPAGSTILRMTSWFPISSGTGCSSTPIVDLTNSCGISLSIYRFIKSDFPTPEFPRKAIFNSIRFWLPSFLFKSWMTLLIVGLLLGSFSRHCRTMSLRGWRLPISVSSFFRRVCSGTKLPSDKRKQTLL